MLFQQALDDASIGFDRRLVADVARLLSKSGVSISVAESITGGLIGSKLSQYPGSSTYFVGGFICYSPILKIKLCGVLPSTIRDHGIVSEAVAREMVEGVSRVTGSSVAISTTGLAGPSGDAVSKVELGTVFVGFKFKSETTVKRFEFAGNRTQVRTRSVNAALGFLRNWLSCSLERGLNDG